MRHYGLFWGELGADLVGVKCCSHTLLLHAWVSVRRARSHPEFFSCRQSYGKSRSAQLSALGSRPKRSSRLHSSLLTD